MLAHSIVSPSLTILVPCLNEAHGIAGVIREYATAFPQAAILVVDNDSDDDTAELARAAGATVMTERRRGKATAVATALAAIDTDLVLMVDGDGSYPAEGAALLLEQYAREPVDMITGIRSAQNAASVFRPMHQWGMSIFAAVLNSVFRFRPLDLFSGLRLFSRRFYKHVPVLSRGFELEIELTIQAVDKGFAQSEVPVPFRSRADGSSSKLKTIHDGLRILRLLVVLFRDYRPLTFFGNVAALLAFFGLTTGSVPVLEYFQTGFVNHLPLAVLAASLVTLSILIGLVGLLLEANLRYHREAYHIQLRKFGAPAAPRPAAKFPGALAG
ncbi:MAG TPA: glycosyltransferase family 2 protein [Chthoniobacterales bacterium]|jgi:glycosyltransferase involved in cell wall biosynthesis